VRFAKLRSGTGLRADLTASEWAKELKDEAVTTALTEEETLVTGPPKIGEVVRIYRRVMHGVVRRGECIHRKSHLQPKVTTRVGDLVRVLLK
jgi:hypothetical protein